MSESLSSSNRKFICTICDESFATNQVLQRHVDGVHLKMKFNCEFVIIKAHRKAVSKPTSIQFI